MPDLEQSIFNQDIGYIQIVALLWDLDVTGMDKKSALEAVCLHINDPANLNSMLDSLTTQEKFALQKLVTNHGRIPWAKFSRQFGSIRELGSGRRDRIKPHLSPESVSESLWYRALICRGFFVSTGTVEEYVYVPDDVLDQLPKIESAAEEIWGRKAKLKEVGDELIAGDWILDHACTILAGLRSGMDIHQIQKHLFSRRPLPFDLTPEDMILLMRSAGMIGQAWEIIPDAVKGHLEQSRYEALKSLVDAWSESGFYNDLLRVPGITAEGNWKNDALRTKKFLFGILNQLPRGVWWNLGSLISAVKENYPDFQRQPGDYDSWYIRDLASGNYLRGFEHWEEIDGAVLRFMIAGPLFWLGIVDLTVELLDIEDTPVRVTAFRINNFGGSIFDDTKEGCQDKLPEPIRIRSDGRLYASARTPRSIRYQVARFSEWDDIKAGAYAYRITPGSLKSAEAQGFNLGNIVSLLSRNSDSLPPGLERALLRWGEKGVECSIKPTTVLRVSHPEIIQSLRKTKSGRFLGDPLGPTAIIIKAGAEDKIQLALAEMGFLSEVEYL
jgi:hypothetical protein